jgi:outer membrane lipoprotein SlyB
MTKSINATFAAALLAASVFGGASAALAGPGDGDYYQGLSNQTTSTIDYSTTQSIRNGAVKAAPTSDEVGPAEGKYYEGLNRH